MSDLLKAAQAYADFLKALGLNSSNAHINIEESAHHAAELMAAWMSGVDADPPHLSLMPASEEGKVSLRDLPFYSFCGHHFVPFFGTVSIEYYPSRKIAGLGGFCRVIDHFSRRPQFQEYLCKQIATHLFEELNPKALRVKLNARQMCLELEGKGAGICVETVQVLGDKSLF